jgi:Holliday junction resolvase RusA-like endonuclease
MNTAQYNRDYYARHRGAGVAARRARRAELKAEKAALQLKAKAEGRRKRGRQRAHSTEFELPIAPSTNGLTRNVPGKGRVKTDLYRRWLIEAGWALKEQHVPKVEGTVSLTFWAAIPKRSRDLDNLIKATLDLLQANGIIENDALVCEIGAKWDRTIPAGRMKIRVRQAFPPELRMSAEGRHRLSASRRGKPHAAAAKALATALL